MSVTEGRSFDEIVEWMGDDPGRANEVFIEESEKGDAASRELLWACHRVLFPPG